MIHCYPIAKLQQYNRTYSELMKMVARTPSPSDVPAVVWANIGSLEALSSETSMRAFAEWKWRTGFALKKVLGVCDWCSLSVVKESEAGASWIVVGNIFYLSI